MMQILEITKASKRVAIALGTTLLAALLSTACQTSTCADTSTCSPSSGASPDRIGGFREVDPPAGCDPHADPKDAVACAVDAYALFVDAKSGSNSNPGTKAAPFKTIEAATNIDALAGRPRIYVCGDATYAENVRLPRNVNLIGGFDCATSQFTTTRPKIRPLSSGYALRIDGSSKALIVSDLELSSKDAEDDGASSVTVLVASANVSFRRVAMTAGSGKGAFTSPTPTNKSPTSPTGETASTSKGLSTKVCTCAFVGASTGGASGDAGKSGQPGSADPKPSSDGAAGSGGTTCTRGGNGGNGKTGGAGGSRPAVLGALTADGWTPAGGTDGRAGDPGAGGGGAGGDSSLGGGGGACGGCGGNGGLGGRGGGASIALALFSADVRLFSCDLSTGKPGDAAAGGDGEGGLSKGFGGGGSCFGGDGGYGAGGGGGGGGAAGISVSVVRKGGTFANDEGTTLTPSSTGVPGAGGKAGSGSSGSPSGEAGQKGPDLPIDSDILELD